MSVKLNVASKYQIEYGNCAYFNGLQEEFNELLSELFDKYCHKDTDWIDFVDDEEITFSSTIEIDKKSFIHIKQRLQELDPEEVILKSNDSDSSYTVKEIVDIFQYLLDNTDPDNDFIHFVWF
jgi:hypothetical protein